MERVTESRARRTGKTAFAAAVSVGLYTAAAFGALLHAGFPAAIACLGAAIVALSIAALAGRLIFHDEERAKFERIQRAQALSAEARAEPDARPAPPPAPLPAPAGETGFAVVEAREARESREIQHALLPPLIPHLDGYHLDVDYQPCGVLGGDFYDFRTCEDGSVLVTLGDVSGKGPAGAIVMAMVQTLFRENAERAAGPADLLARVNDGFSGALGKGIFVTALAGRLDPATHQFTLAGAGHHPLLLLNASERRSTQVSARGLALGLAQGETFTNALVETTIDLAPGDALLLYTDGATECEEELTSGLGESRFFAAAAGAVLAGPEGALQRLRADLWGTASRLRDDVTLLLAARRGGRGPDLASDRNAAEIKT